MSKIKNGIIFGVKLIFCLILMAWIFSKIEINLFLKIFRQSDIKIFIVAYLFLLLNTGLSSYKWKILLEADGIKIPFIFLIKSYLVATFANLFLPSNIGGDVVRIYDVAKHSKDSVKSAASVLIDRASGFFALSFIGFIASLSSVSFLNDTNFFSILCTVFIIIVLMFILLFNKKIHRLMRAVLSFFKIQKASALFNRFTDSLDSYKKQPGTLFKILLISFFFQLMVVGIVYLYSLGLHMKISFLYFLIFIPIITVIESIPLTPFALGIRDASYVFFFTKVGLSIEQAESLAITYILMTFAYAFLGGGIFIFQKRKI